MNEDRKIKRGEIYWISYNKNSLPVGCVQRPGRPGVVVSNDLNNINSYLIEIIYLTTAPKKDLPTHCTIRSAEQKSTALCEQITTVDLEQIGDYIGTCTSEEMAQIDICMTISLGIDLTQKTKAAAKPADTRTVGDEAMIREMRKQIDNLRIDLAKAQKGEDLMKELYTQLLESRTKKRAT